MVLDPIPQSLPVHFFGSRPQPPTSRLILVCDMTHSCEITYSYLWHDLFMCVRWLFNTAEDELCDMIHSYMWRGLFKFVTRLICIRDTADLYVWHDSFICVTWPVHAREDELCDMTHSYVWHDSFICDMTHSHVWHDSFICVRGMGRRRLFEICQMRRDSVHMFDLTHSYVWHDSFICVTWLIHMCDIMMFWSYVCVGGGKCHFFGVFLVFLAVFLEPAECDGSIFGICQIWHDNLIVERWCFTLYVCTHNSSPYKRSLLGRLSCVYTVTAPRNRQSIWERRCGGLCMLLVLKNPFF